MQHGGLQAGEELQPNPEQAGRHAQSQAGRCTAENVKVSHLQSQWWCGVQAETKSAGAGGEWKRNPVTQSMQVNGRQWR